MALKVKRMTQKSLAKYKQYLFVFGDNMLRRGTGGQAQIRYCKNSIGIATKRKPSMEDDAFFSDDDYESIKRIIDNDINKIKLIMRVGNYKDIVFPLDGIGTGRARMKEKAPRLFEYLSDRLMQDFGFDNRR